MFNTESHLRDKITDKLFDVNNSTSCIFQSVVWFGRRPSFFFLTMCTTFSSLLPFPMPDSLLSGSAIYISRYDVLVSSIQIFIIAYQTKFSCLTVIFVFILYMLSSFPAALPRGLYRVPPYSTAALHLSSRGRWTPPGG